MKLQKRSSAPEEASAAQEPQGGGKKPVVVYIMILFIVAFFLMALSFFMHQRSNSEAIGRLQDSVSALKEVQATQDENIRLQEELTAVQKEAAGAQAALQKKLDDAAAEADAAQRRADALTALYTLQQQYATRDYAGCAATIAAMESAGQDRLLPATLDTDGVTSPAQRYLQLREAAAQKTEP